MTDPARLPGDPLLTSCPSCPDWQVPCWSDDEKQRKEATHATRLHGMSVTPVPLTPGVAWQEQAVEAVRTTAALGEPFTIYDALRTHGIPDPPNARTALGRFSTLVHDLQIAHPVAFQQSDRPQTNRSAVRVWSREVRRCQDVRCKARAGIEGVRTG